MTPVLLTFLFLAAWLWREHRFQAERLAWGRERSELLNRIKPETAQPLPGPEPELFDHIPSEGPQADQEFWDDRERIA